jgi:hypothetical protein
MGSLSPNDRARAASTINLELIELQKRRNRATTVIADALVEIATCETLANTLLDDLAEVRKPNAGNLSGG